MGWIAVPLSLLLAAASPQDSRDPPFETPSPGPTVRATATPSPGPTPSQTYDYILEPKLAGTPAPGDAVILKVEFNRRRYTSHDEVQIQVLTSADVVRVTNYEMGRGGKMREVSPGVFRAEGTVPNIPFFLNGMKVEFHFKAVTADGKTTAFSVPVTF